MTAADDKNQDKPSCIACVLPVYCLCIASVLLMYCQCIASVLVIEPTLLGINEQRQLLYLYSVLAHGFLQLLPLLQLLLYCS